MVVIVVPEILKLETTDEGSYVKWVTAQGFDCLKVNKRSWPDRLTILNNGYSFYIEFKREGKADKFGRRKGEKFQIYTHKNLRKRGIHVYLVDDAAQAKEIFKYELEQSTLKRSGYFKELKF